MRRTRWLVVPTLCLLALSAEASAVTPNSDQPVSGVNEQTALLAEPAVISNGTLVLGINPEGHLNAIDPVTGDFRGLQYLPTGGDAISPGCQCEGWGIANPSTSLSGWATVDNALPSVSDNLELVSFTSDGVEADSIVRIGGEIEVRHRFRPAVGDSSLYVIDLTVTNLTSTDATYLYRRVIDWDVPPTEFDDYVTIAGSAPEMVRVNNDGFGHPDPLVDSALDPQVDPFVEGTFSDLGVFDHGAMIDISLGTIAPGQSRTVLLFYGAAGDEFSALASLTAVGASIYSLGQPSSADGAELGVPNTFLFGYCGANCFDDNLPPTSAFAATPIDWNGPFLLQFDSSGSSDPEGGFLVYEWDFGDGTTSTLNNPQHAFVPGAYDVSLTVTDSAGQTDVANDTLIISGDPLVDFAPEVRLHPDEDHFPMTPSAFIANSDLEWGHTSPCQVDNPIMVVDPASLGGGDYRHQAGRVVSGGRPGPRCVGHKPGWYYSDQLTRPYDGNPQRVAIDDEEGFNLNFDQAADQTSFAPMPVWTEVNGTTRLEATYWFFYGRSIPRGDFGVALPSHEGDWENVNVVLSPTTRVPVEVEFFAHGDPEIVPFADLDMTNLLHPAVYAARSAHGSYPDPGSTRVGGVVVDERSDGGAVWQTWLDLRPARSQPWYGFGGAWGEKGAFGETTGPLGPSIWKLPAVP